MLSSKRSERPPLERMFTFLTSSQKPTRTVWCHNCDWKAQGNSNAVFKKADEHDCLTFEIDDAIGEVAL